MKPLDQNSTLYIRVLRDFKRWAKDQLPPMEEMVGQTETHFPCKAAYAVAVYDHDLERWTAIRVLMSSGEWEEIELRA